MRDPRILVVGAVLVIGISLGLVGEASRRPGSPLPVASILPSGPLASTGISQRGPLFVAVQRGGVGMVFRGTWDSGVMETYAAGDVVTFDNSVYVAADVPKARPPDWPWALLVSQAKDGAAGPTGAQGPVGPTGPSGGLTGWQVVSVNVTIPAKGLNNPQAIACPTGKKPLGGGYSSSTIYVTETASYPDPDGPWVWYEVLANTSQASETVTIYAVCANVQ